LSNGKVGIIIPCYNCEEYIEEAVLSCFNQYYEDFVVIVVDDCSSDNSLVVLEQFFEVAKYGNKFVCLKNDKNLGASESRNIAAKVALQMNCEFLLFHDADDVMTKNSIVDRIGIFGNPLVSLVYGDYYNLLEDGSVTYENKADFNFHRLVEDNYITCLSMTRTKLFHQVGGFNRYLTYCEDMSLWLRIAQFGIAIHVHSPCFYYRCNPNSQTRNINWEIYNADREIVMNEVGLFLNKTTPENLMLAQNKKLLLKERLNEPKNAS